MNSVGERIYFYTGAGNLYALFQRGSNASFFTGLSVHGGINLYGDLRFDNEHHVINIDGLVGKNDIRYVVGNDSYYHSFCNSAWNEHAWITASGGLEIDGNFIGHGSKNFRIEHPEDKNKYLQYAAIESPEVALKIRGQAELKNGIAEITMPHHWELVTSDHLLTAQVTPIGDCKGLHIPELEVSKLVVKESQGGKSGVKFYWEVTATRKGFEDFDIEPTKDAIIEQNVLNAIKAEKEPKRKKRSELEKGVFMKRYKELTGKDFAKEGNHGKNQ